MEEMRGSAMAYFANFSDDQRQLYESFASLMGRDGDGKVSYREYSEFIRKQGYYDVPPNLFMLLDKNNRGYLDFEECVTLFYMITCNRFLFCGGHKCNSHLLGLHFQCVQCYKVGKKTYNLCSTCYRDTNFNHEHSDFLDNYDLLQNKPREARNRMEEFSKTAELYYKRSSSDIQEKAKTFFESLDNNNDKKISLDEFLGFVSEGGHEKMSDRGFFEALDKDGKGYLEFMDVMGLCYINKSGRPFCGRCDEFIPGMYFTCSKCFEDGNNLFSLCPKCIEDGKFVHEHDQFLDNYALLEAKRLEGIASKHQKVRN
ncbi:hypothetical protein RHMOL_Rhmol02G0049800 [Rhododendron molle]|uniref:Uncharacterized protein n=1 Tax=Rhododendron molle TaxID=49168 RepID=A0ACC0PLJ6_RHOML|nr:hypothetical protein RHMOL_Rhmol02G0049800 [Rhododendron molle]